MLLATPQALFKNSDTCNWALKREDTNTREENIQE